MKAEKIKGEKGEVTGEFCRVLLLVVGGLLFEGLPLLYTVLHFYCRSLVAWWLLMNVSRLIERLRISDIYFHVLQPNSNNKSRAIHSDLGSRIRIRRSMSNNRNSPKRHVTSKVIASTPYLI